jgi:branched-chain amino acid transport system ATP-binding protein
MLLEARNIEAAYDISQVLFSVSFEVREGEVVAFLGRNGMGKSTAVAAIMGLLPIRGGEIRFNGERIDGLPPHRIAQRGIGLVPEGRRIFPNLSVFENLEMAAANRRGEVDPWTIERVLALFPRLSERLKYPGNRLSGGEQQMLAIGRALVTNPKLLVLDEATEGLAPLIREEIWNELRGLKRQGLAMIVIDKDIHALSALAGRHFMFEKGRIEWAGTSAELLADTAVQDRYLTV